ncbi:MAG: sulfotransferase family 2 domain-containing protein [Erysipelotrichaceae bacterium]|nr:sulfotransferase family 2 domain-containing protein [Erysipelotrichaceae bacterium]
MRAKIENYIKEQSDYFEQHPVQFHCLQIILNFLYSRYDRYYYRNEYILLPDKKLAYLNNSKVACSSIKIAMQDKHYEDDYSIHWDMVKNGYSKPALGENEKDYYKFTFVRNPFDRLVSCYQSKFHADQEIYRRDKEDFEFADYPYGNFSIDDSFDSFVRKVVKIPNHLLDRHFCIQTSLVYDPDGKPKVDFIGKFENLEEEFEPIRKKYDLNPLPHYNSSHAKDYRTYYTEETAKLVYKKYKKDFNTFGYTDSYYELLEYLKSKETTE